MAKKPKPKPKAKGKEDMPMKGKSHKPMMKGMGGQYGKA